MKRDLRFEVTYAHPPELVWRALTERALLAEWLMDNDFVPELGARFQFHTEPQPGFDGIVHCQVLEFEPEKRMRWSWKGGQLDTEVSFTLEPIVVFSRLHTRLILEHTGFEGLRAVLVSFILGSGWGKMKDRLILEVLERLSRGESVRGSRECDAERARRRSLSKVWSAISARLRRGTGPT